MPVILIKYILLHCVDAVAVAVGVGAVWHLLISVGVHIPPALGQTKHLVPQNSALPAKLHTLSVGPPPASGG